MDIKSNELFWNATISELKEGVIEENDGYRCIICEEISRVAS